MGVYPNTDIAGSPGNVRGCPTSSDEWRKRSNCLERWIERERRRCHHDYPRYTLTNFSTTEGQLGRHEWRRSIITTTAWRLDEVVDVTGGWTGKVYKRRSETVHFTLLWLTTAERRNLATNCLYRADPTNSTHCQSPSEDQLHAYHLPILSCKLAPPQQLPWPCLSSFPPSTTTKPSASPLRPATASCRFSRRRGRQSSPEKTCTSPASWRRLGLRRHLAMRAVSACVPLLHESWPTWHGDDWKLHLQYYGPTAPTAAALTISLSWNRPWTLGSYTCPTPWSCCSSAAASDPSHPCLRDNVTTTRDLRISHQKLVGTLCLFFFIILGLGTAHWWPSHSRRCTNATTLCFTHAENHLCQTLTLLNIWCAFCAGIISLRFKHR